MPRVRTVVLTAVMILMAGCGSKDAVDPGANPTLEPASPVSLHGTAGGFLKTAPAVVVHDSRGSALPGVSIRWRVGTGGGQLVDAVTHTDSDGRASALWLLPGNPGTYGAVAQLASASDSVVFEAVAGPDTVPPALVRLERRDSAVSVGNSPVVARFTVVSADSGSGVYWTLAHLVSPGGNAFTTCSTLADAADSTTEHAAVCDFTIPAYAEAGPWRISTLALQDRIANETQLSGDSLASLGYPVTVQVSSSTPDTTPPELTALSFAPDSVAVDSSDVPVLFTAHLTDSLSGVARAQFATDAPAQNGLGFVECLEMKLKPGDDAHDGTWRCAVTFAQGSRPGTWKVVRFTAWDVAGNSKSWMTTDLEAAGFPTEITVTNADADTVPPVLRSFVVTPDSVQLSGSNVDVQVSIGAADAGAGIAQVSAGIRAPGSSTASGTSTDTPTQGTAADGVYTVTVTIPAAGVAGAWAIDEIYIVDAVGNTLNLSTQDLVDAGFDPYVQVTR